MIAPCCRLVSWSRWRGPWTTRARARSPCASPSPGDAGTVRFLRSSANHVFVCDSGVLRFRPDGLELGSSRLRRPRAAWRSRLSVAAPLPSLGGRARGLTPTATPRRCSPQSPAARSTRSSLTPDLARAWGTGLARFHDAGSRRRAGRPVVARRRRRRRAAPWRVTELLDELRTAADLGRARRRRPRRSRARQRDLERDRRPVFVDVDDVSRSWFAADVAFALRDFVDSPLAEHFVAGYREARPLTDDELAWLPLFRRAHALVTLARLAAGPRRARRRRLARLGKGAARPRRDVAAELRGKLG